MRILVAYVPVIHSGYISFFEEYAQDVSYCYIFDEEIISNFSVLKKDIRRINPNTAKKIIDALGIFPNKVRLLKNEDIKKIRSIKPEVVMPDDDVSRDFVRNYISDFSIEYYPVFLRWDKTRSKTPKEVEPDRVSSNLADKYFMSRAYECAKRSPDQWRQVGAVVVLNGKLIYQTYNTHIPTPYTPYIDGDPRGNFKKGSDIEISTAVHCEMQAISWAARMGISLQGAHMYVTTFPCPWCAKSIALSGISKLFYSEGYSVLDGFRVLKMENIEIVRVEQN